MTLRELLPGRREHGRGFGLRLCLIAVPLLFLLSGSGCVNMLPVCEQYYALPVQQQEAEFRTYDFEKQLAIYHCGMEQVHPPDITLARVIAGGGDRNIAALLERLKSEKSENRQEHIIYILQLMSREGHLSGRRDVIDEVRRVTSAMQNEVVRARNQEKLSEIERNSSR